MSFCCCLDLIAIFFGLYVIIPRILTFWEFVNTTFIQKKLNLIERYSENGKSWALVTGCTSGIGQELAFRLAQEGFNIVLVSRSMDKLNQVDKEIREATKGKIQTRIVQANFSKGNDLKVYEDIVEKVNDLDIAILVNNAGVLHYGYLNDVKVEQIVDMSIVNTYPYILLTRALMSQLKSRKSTMKTAILNVSSSVSYLAAPYESIYSSTKVFNRYCSEALRLENIDTNIDVLTICPMWVSTQMTHNLATSLSGVITPTQYVEAVLKAMGNTSLIFGPPIHQFEAYKGQFALKICSHFRFSYYIVNNIIKGMCDKMT